MGNRNRVTYAVQDVFVGSPLGNSNTAWPALNTIKAFNITGFTGDGDLIGTNLVLSPAIRAGSKLQLYF